MDPKRAKVASLLNLSSLIFFFIAIIPYTLLNVGKPSWSWVIPRDHVQVRPGFHLGSSLVVFLNNNTQNFVTVSLRLKLIFGLLECFIHLIDH